MTFIDRFLSVLEAHPDRAFSTEVRGSRLVETKGASLRAMVEQARHALRARGVAPGDRVVLVAPNSTRWIATDLALLAEGTTVVPLYARQAPVELAGMICDADVKLILVADEALRTKLTEALGETTVPVALVETLFEGDVPAQREAARPVAPDHVVTIIYTSGSSGEPKGVLTTVANAEYMLPLLDVKLRELSGTAPGRDRVFHYLPFCFAGSRMVLWACLHRENGIMVSTDLDNLLEEIGTAKPEYFLNVPALLERIRLGVDKKMATESTPIRWLYTETIAAWRRRREGRGGLRDQALIASAKAVIFPAIRKKLGPDLRGLICGSAPLAEETQRWFVELLDVPVFQVYGLTETTAIVTIDRKDAVSPGRVGHAIPGCEIKLGEGDELLVRGPNIFPGYFRREAATAEAFDADGWFRTGDQCTLDERGNLQIIGRVKNILVPTSGHNVAPEPLEERLLERVPGVEQAVVIGHAKPHLTAIVTGTVIQASLDEGLARVNDGLPHYRRIRRAVVVGEKLTPENGLLTANNKLRRRAIEQHFSKTIDGLYVDDGRDAARAAKQETHA